MAAYTYPGGQDGQCLNAQHLNYLFGAAETTLENSMNIAKLQYCQSVTDIDHDYMVVDVFTDTTGYENTVCTTRTTSTHIGSALTGHYSNAVSAGSFVCVGTTGNGAVSVGVCCSCGCANDLVSSATYSYCKQLSNFCCFCFLNHACVIATGTAVYSCSCSKLMVGATQIFCSVNSLLNTTGNCDCTHEICFLRCAANCYSVYKNGACCCAIAADTICITGFVSTNRVGGDTACAWQCNCLTHTSFSDLGTKIGTVDVVYSCPIGSAYLSVDKVGTGVVALNVINTATGNCIACNVPANCYYPLTCCVCCHSYEIIQCCGATSCILSYAIAAGEA